MPGSGGEVRSYFFIRMLAQLGDLTLVSLGGPGGDRKVSNDLANLCERVIEPKDDWRPGKQTSVNKSRIGSWARSLAVLLMPWRGNWREFYRYCMQYLHSDAEHRSAGKRLIRTVLRTQFRIGARFGLMPSRSVFAYSDQFNEVRNEALDAIAGQQFDFVWYEHTITYPFAAELIDSATEKSRPPLVCNAHNIEWQLHERISNVATDKWEAEFNKLQSGLLKKLEIKQFKDCELVFTCSEDDENLGQQMAPDTEFVTVGNGVHTEYFRPSGAKSRAETPTLLFTGTFGYGPNRDGLKYFVDEIFPLIRKSSPETEFVFAGYEAQRVYDELGIDTPGIRCVSSPDDIRPCFEEAWVFVVPLRAGSGTRLKILEAMSMQCPVVSTQLGAEGIIHTAGKHLLIANSPPEFANAVLELLSDADRREMMGSAASEWVSARYSWALLCGEAENHLLSRFAMR